MLVENIEILLDRVRKKTQAIRFILEQNKHLRDILFTDDVIRHQQLTQLGFNLSDEHLISPKEWELYEHSAVILQLYATYENFFEELITKWLDTLPKLITQYDQLDEQIREQHRIGIGNLLSSFGDNRYKDLELNKIVYGLFYGTNKNQKYELIPEAFLVNHKNLRQGELKKLLSFVGLHNPNPKKSKDSFCCWKWLTHHQNIRKYMESETFKSRNILEESSNYIYWRSAFYC